MRNVRDVGSFDKLEVILAVGMPENLVPVALPPIGHPREEPGRRQRRSRDEVVEMVREGERR